MTDVPSSSGGSAMIRARFIAWSAFVVALLILFVSRVLPALKIETDILALLPSTQQDSAIDAALDQFAARLARNQVFLIGHEDPAKAKGAARAFAVELKSSDAFARVEFELNEDLRSRIDPYLEHRAYLISKRDRELLQSGQIDALERRALRAAFTPAGLVQQVDLAEDPLGLVNALLTEQRPFLGNAQLDGSMLTVTQSGVTYVMILAECSASPFASSLQERALPAIERAKQAAAQKAGPVIIVSSGALQHAAAATTRASAEIATFGTIETVAVVLLLWTILGALRPLMLATITLGVAALAAMTVVHYLFGTVHLLALVFGSSLIGGVIDYSIHFFADRFRDPIHWTPAAALRHVGGAIVLGLTTTLIGYVVLALVPFPGLKQIAVFCATGLAVGCGCVLCWYPVLASARGRLPVIGTRIGERIDRFMRGWQWTPVRVWIAATLLLLALFGLTRAHVQDDIRTLQASPPELVKAEQTVRELLGSGVETRFFLVTGSSEQAALEAEQALTDRLDGLVAGGALTSYQAISDSVPPLVRQDAAHRLLAEKVFAPVGLLDRVLPKLGFPPASVEDRRRAFLQSNEPLQLDQFLRTRAADTVRHLWLGRVGDRFASVVTLGGIRDVQALSGFDVPNATLIDRVASTTEILGRYRTAMSWLLAIIYIAAGVVLVVRFGLREAPRILLPSALATAVTLGIFGWAHIPINLFTLLALWLVLGLGIDYGIFIRHGQASDEAASRPTAILSVTLSACTTLLAFGLLAFSATPFIRSIGLTLLCAIMLSWLFVLFSCLTLSDAAVAPPPAGVS